GWNQVIGASSHIVPPGRPGSRVSWARCESGTLARNGRNWGAARPNPRVAARAAAAKPRPRPAARRRRLKATTPAKAPPKAAVSGWPESRINAVIAAVVATARWPGWRKRRTVPAASHGTQAAVAVTGNSAQEKRPPPRAKPAAASSDEARLRPVERASSHVP